MGRQLIVSLALIGACLLLGACAAGLPVAQSGQVQPTSDTLAPVQTMAGGNTPMPAVSPTREASPSPQPALPSATALPLPTPSPTFDPYPPPYIYPTAPPVPPPPVASAWLTYTHASGVQLLYPDDWLVKATQLHTDSYPFVSFTAPEQDSTAIYFCAMLEVYDRPLADRAITDPYSWQPNEAGGVVLWIRPVQSADGINGFLYIYGNEGWAMSGWHVGPYLEAIYYDERHELDIRLSSCVDYESVALIETGAYEEVIATRFAVFERMVRSVRVVRPPP